MVRFCVYIVYLSVLSLNKFSNLHLQGGLTVTLFHVLSILFSSRSVVKTNLKLLHVILIIHYIIFFILFVLCFCFSGIFLIQEMLQYSFLTTTRKLLIVLGLWYVIVGVFIFADSEVLAIMQDIRGNSFS